MGKGENSALSPTNEDFIEFVCFVNEYYYQSIEWPKFVNTLDREFLLWIKHRNRHQEEIVPFTSDALFVIRQRSIQTVYDLNKGIDYNAWGIETVNETGLFSTSSNPSKIKDMSYGRLNLPPKLNNGNWSTF